jgi:hypothetical protein
VNNLIEEDNDRLICGLINLFLHIVTRRKTIFPRMVEIGQLILPNYAALAEHSHSIASGSYLELGGTNIAIGGGMGALGRLSQSSEYGQM